MPEPLVNEFGRHFTRVSGAPASGDEIRVHDVSEDTVIVKTFANVFAEIYIRTGQEYQLSSTPKVGATAGWVVNGATNLGELATLPASQSGSTLVLRVTGLKIGWTVTAYKVELQIESAGGTVTVDTDLRKETNAAADPVDASIGTTTQVSVTADTKVEVAKTGLAEVIAADEWLYILITATTGASTDIRLLGATVTVTEG